MLGRTVAILIVFSVVFAQSAYAQRLAEPVQSQISPTLIPPTPSEPNCYQVTQRVPYACIHVLHGGSDGAAHSMNKNKSPQFEMSCEVQVPLEAYFGGREFVAEKGMQIDFSTSGLDKGSNFTDGYKLTVRPDKFDSFNRRHPANMDMDSRVFLNILPGSQDFGKTSGEKVKWWRVNLDTTNQILSLRSIWNGYGECRYEKHCYAYINQLKLTFEVCES